MYTVGPTLSVRGALSIFSLEVGATPPTRAGRRRVVGCDPCGAPNKCRRARRPDLRNPMPTILVIDDNPSVATALDELFSLQDIDTLRAESTSDGRAQLTRKSVGEGKGGEVSVDSGGRRIMEKKNRKERTR